MCFPDVRCHIVVLTDSPGAAEFPLRIGEGANPKPEGPDKGGSNPKEIEKKNDKKPRTLAACRARHTMDSAASCCELWPPKEWHRWLDLVNEAQNVRGYTACCLALLLWPFQLSVPQLGCSILMTAITITSIITIVPSLRVIIITTTSMIIFFFIFCFITIIILVSFIFFFIILIINITKSRHGDSCQS